MKQLRRSEGEDPSKSPRRRRKSDPAPTTAGSASPDLWEILGRFDEALSLVIVCHQSLAAKESADIGDEEEVLRQGIRLLKEVHRELDRGSTPIKAKRTSGQTFEVAKAR
jgi:hypothetical protein